MQLYSLKFALDRFLSRGSRWDFVLKYKGKCKKKSYGQILFVSILIFGTSICFNPVKGMTDKASVSGRDMPSDPPVSSMQGHSPNMTDKPSVSGRDIPSDPPVSSMQRDLPSLSLETDVQVIDLLIWFDSGYFIIFYFPELKTIVL